MAPFWGLSGRKLHWAVWTESLVCISIFGYATASAGGVLNGESFRKQFPTIDVTDAPPDQKHDKSVIQGTVVAMYTLLGAFGAIACTFLGDRLGRRMTIFVAAMAVFIGGLLMSTSYSLGQFIVARCVLGLGVGGITATVPVWQSELSKTKSRGSHVSSFGIYCGIGGLEIPIIDCVLAVIVMCFIFTLPESPRWLKLKDRHEEAKRVLDLLHPGDPEAVEKEIEDIELALRISVRHTSLLSMFSMGPQRIFHRVVLASILQIMLQASGPRTVILMLHGVLISVQMTGVNAIAFYAPTIYEQQLHFPAVEAGVLAAASQACLILGGILCAFTVDRFGRRPLMMFSASAMCVCFVCVTALTSQPDNRAASKAAVFFLYLYYVVYTVGYIGIPFLYASEIAPVQLRAAICGLSTAISWLFNFMVVEVTPVGFEDIGYQYFIIYTVLNATFVPMVYFFYPETAGRSLEELDAIFAQSKSIFDTVRVAKQMPKIHLKELGYEKKAADLEHMEKYEAV
ncbi:hypothetical protein DPSP01_004616 [Paraphaeosphaeria sporulosa]